MYNHPLVLQKAELYSKSLYIKTTELMYLGKAPGSVTLVLDSEISSQNIFSPEIRLLIRRLARFMLL